MAPRNPKKYPRIPPSTQIAVLSLVMLILVSYAAVMLLHQRLNDDLVALE
jgi:hypothetical protein